MMGQKINSNILRRGKRLNWQFLWNTKLSHYCIILDFSLNRYLSNFKFFNILGFVLDNVFESFNNKTNKSFVQFFIQNNFFKIMLKQKRFLKKKHYYKVLKCVTNIHQSFYFLVLLQPLLKKNFNSKSNKFLSFIEAQTIANCLVNYISAMLKENSFKNSLYNYFEKVCEVLVKNITLYNKTQILGLKIILKGKWRQTKDGRKETIQFTLGNIQTQNTKFLVSYGCKTFITKYGCCSVKVWMCFKEVL